MFSSGLAFVATFITFIIIEINAENLNLEKVAPIVWDSPHLYPISGYEYRTHVAYLVDPCFIFPENRSFECKQLYHKVLNQINLNCHDETLKNIEDQLQIMHASHSEMIKENDQQEKNMIEASIITGIFSYGVLGIEPKFIKIKQNSSINDMKEEYKNYLKFYKNQENMNEYSKLNNSLVFEMINKKY